MIFSFFYSVSNISANFASRNKININITKLRFILLIILKNSSSFDHPLEFSKAKVKLIFFSSNSFQTSPYFLNMSALEKIESIKRWKYGPDFLRSTTCSARVLPRPWTGKISRDFLLRWFVCCQETRTKQMVNVRLRNKKCEWAGMCCC